MSDSTQFKLAILCGGKSSRMGEDKAHLRVNDLPLFQFQINRLKELALPTYLSVNKKQKLDAGYPRIIDVEHEIGPIGAMKSVLKFDVRSNWVLLPVDMPQISMITLQRLLEKSIALKRSVFCKVNNFIQPFPCVIRPSLYPTIELNIQRRKYKLLELIQPEVCSVIDMTNSKEEFLNLNTDREYQKFLSGKE